MKVFFDVLSYLYLEIERIKAEDRMGEESEFSYAQEKEVGKLFIVKVY